MSVEAIRLQSFMAFEDTGWITLRPVCLLFGKNSSGKSAITRALRFLKQSLDARPDPNPRARSSPFLFDVEDSVDVGTFNTILHRGYDMEDYDTEQNREIGPVTFAFRCTLQNAALIDGLYAAVNAWREQHNWPAIPVDKAQDTVDIWLSYCQGGQNTNQMIWLSEVRVTCPWATMDVEEIAGYDGVSIFLAADMGGVLEWTGPNNWYVSSALFKAHLEDGHDAWQDAWVELEDGFLPVVLNPDDPDVRASAASSQELEYVTTLIGELHSDIVDFLQGIEYVGPLRPAPERVYMLKPYEVRKWRATGLAGFADFLQGKLTTEEYRRLNNWLQHMGLAYRVVARPWAGIIKGSPDSIVSSILVYESKEAWGDDKDETVLDAEQKEERDDESPETQNDDNGIPVNLVDCGFGITQVLPVLIAALRIRSDRLLVIEQPELHLHGSAQTQLCDVYIDNATRKSRTKAIERAKIAAGEDIRTTPEPQLDALKARFLIETHSEHTLLRLQRRIAESTQDFIDDQNSAYISGEDAIVHFVNRDKSLGVSQIHRGEPDTMGVIKLPESFRGFFSDDAKEARLWAGVRLGHPAPSSEE